MVDIAPDSKTAPGNANGGAMLSPARSFEFLDGRFVVEADFAAGHPDYGGEAWGEILITTSPTLRGKRRRDGLYGYDRFPDHFALGCRLQADRHTICSLMDDSPAEVGTSDARLWEMSFFQHVGTEVFGGYPDIEAGDEHFRLCQAGEPDSMCHDRFRLELTETSLTIWVNGLLYFKQSGLAALPPELLTGDLYVYLGSMVVGHQAEVVRFHWDRLAVNPLPGPGVSDTF